MNVGIIGLGKIGGAVAQRLVNTGHNVIGFDIDRKACQQASVLGVMIASDISTLAQQARVLWLFVPAGHIIDTILQQLIPHVKSGDIIIDGGNSNFHDSMRRNIMLESFGIYYLDCGVSGGIQGTTYGFCLMVGGNLQAFTKVRTMMEAVATPGGLAHVGPSGAGHYVKMVHNGIEYGLLQAYAEGIQLMKEGSFKEAHLDVEEITRIWQHGSIIRSWILELTHDILARDSTLEHVEGEIDETGTGRWAVEDARVHNVPVPVLKSALEVRKKSRENERNFTTKLIALLRHEFGGHPFKKK